MLRNLVKEDENTGHGGTTNEEEEVDPTVTANQWAPSPSFPDMCFLLTNNQRQSADANWPTEST